MFLYFLRKFSDGCPLRDFDLPLIGSFWPLGHHPNGLAILKPLVWTLADKTKARASNSVAV